MATFCSRSRWLRHLFTAAVLIAWTTACMPAREVVVVFHAGSLSALFHQVFERFEQHHPGVRIQSEGSGSLDAIRKITELRRSCDLVAVADHRLIKRFLVPEQVSQYSVFLGNELVLATAQPGLFLQGSTKEAWREDWYERITSGKYSYGISNPDRDPAGYYSHLSWKLAEIYYGRAGIYRRLVRQLETRWIRPKSSELVALLQTENLDFAFLYKSTAIQNNLEFLSFPPEVSLGEATYKDVYSRVFVHVAGDEPGSTIEIIGAPIRYGIALLDTEDPWAGRLLNFLLSPEIQDLYRELGYTSISIERVVSRESSS